MPLNNVNHIRAIVFDVDGTLYPQRPLQKQMLWELASQLARDPRATLRTLKVLRAYRKAHELARNGVGPGGAGDLQLIIASEIASEQPEFVERTASEWLQRRPLRHLKSCLPPDLVSFLQKARDLGMRLGVVSDYPAVEKLSAMGIFDRFDAVISSQDQDIGLLKPNPRGLQTCLAKLAVDPADSVYVGDRADVDLPCASRAKTQFVLFGKPPARSKCVSVASYRQLSEVLGFQSQG